MGVKALSFVCYCFDQFLAVVHHVVNRGVTV